MSRKITNKLNITDADLAKDCLHLAGLDFQEHGKTLLITSGELHHARLDLETGIISGDSDHGHSAAKFGMLRQYYAEAQLRQEYAKNGTTVDERQSDLDGNIVLMWHMA
jgi:hypothetical protein